LGKVISVNTWDCVLSAAGFVDSLDIAYGLNVKYLYYKRNGAYIFDTGFFKNIDVGDIVKIKLGISVQNFISVKIKIDNFPDEILVIYRLSSAFILLLY
jgi:hypothetical protein